MGRKRVLTDEQRRENEKLAQAKYRANNKDKIRQRALEWREKNRGLFRQRRRDAWRANADSKKEKSREYRATDPAKWQQAAARYREENNEAYRLTIAAREGKRRAEQEEVAGRLRPNECEMCGSVRRICFDHCHTTGRFRGWLCVQCNAALGMVGEDPKLLRRLADFIEETAKRFAEEEELYW